MRRQGPLADAEIVFDGKALTLHGKRHNVFAQIESPGTIDDAIETVRADIGLDAPGADLLYADPYPGLTAEERATRYAKVGIYNHQWDDPATFRQIGVLSAAEIGEITGTTPCAHKSSSTSARRC
mgnify:CR=1 FL=1